MSASTLANLSRSADNCVLSTADEEMPMADSDRKLTTNEAAEIAGMKRSSWNSRVSRGTAPAPDGRYDGRTPWWWESTVRRFVAERKPAGRPRKG